MTIREILETERDKLAVEYTAEAGTKFRLPSASILRRLALDIATVVIALKSGK